jgi:hypothetical protein
MAGNIIKPVIFGMVPWCKSDGAATTNAPIQEMANVIAK